jgi:oxygen-dependent protoporphyrinogen oxidase
MLSFTEGLESLPQSIATKLGDSIQTTVAIDSIESLTNGWNVKGRRMGDTFNHPLDKLIVTIPLHQLAKLPFCQGNAVGGDLSQSLEDLNTIDHPPLSTLVLGFERNQISHPLDGFGMLIPAKEKRFILGSIFSSSLFPNRAPQGEVSLMNFIGGVTHPDRAELTEAELVDRSCRDLRDLLGLRGQPKFVHRKLWKQAIPQYQVGHGLFIKQLEEIEKRHPDIYFQGNYRGGPGLNDCIENALKLARSGPNRAA